MKQYQRGSIWRRWDLHIHSPASLFNNQFEGADIDQKWSNYFEKLTSINNISVLGITDYYSIEGYQRVKREFDNGNLNNIDLVLPNVELRVDIRTDRNHAINFHIIFSPEIVETLHSRFFTELKFTFGTRTYKCIKEDLIALGKAFKPDDSLDDTSALKEGAQQFKVNFHDLFKLFKSDIELRKNSFILVPNNSNDGNSGIKDDSFSAIRQQIYFLVDGIFSSRPGDVSYFLGKGSCTEEQIKKMYGSLLPCYHGSDAHKCEDIGKVDNKRYNYLKCDPTFQGLLQTKFEPLGRVYIGELSPETSFKKPFFSKIIIQNEDVFKGENLTFKGKTIELNPNLISIIGGRGSGKSLLLDSVRDTFSSVQQKTSLSNFRVVYQKTDGEELVYKVDEENNLDYLHVSQGEMKRIVESYDDLDLEIKKMLEIGEESLVDDKRDEILDGIDRFVETLEFFNYKNENGEFENSIDYCKQNIKRYEQLLETITTKKNKELIENYTTNQKTLASLNELKADLLNLMKLSNSYVKKANELIEPINDYEGIKSKISLQNNNYLLGETKILNSEIDGQIKIINTENDKISKDLKAAGVDDDIPTVLGKAKDYQNNLDKYKRKLKTIERSKDNLKKYFTIICSSTLECKDILSSELDHINERWRVIKEGRVDFTEEQQEITNKILEDIEVESGIRFDKEKFISTFREGLNGGKFRSTKSENSEDRISKLFSVNSYEDYIEMLNNKEVFTLDDGTKCDLKSLLDKDFFLKGAEAKFLKGIMLPVNREKFLKVISVIKYKGKIPRQLSVGQRGTLYLCMKLATETFGTPLIFDQPEDDLDNNFITNKLVPLLNEVKKYRQVILVTHNANVVVNGDSEQVIIAENNEEKISYKAGAIENTSEEINIRDHVCNVLEGGKDAFKNREKKYDF